MPVAIFIHPTEKNVLGNQETSEGACNLLNVRVKPAIPKRNSSTVVFYPRSEQSGNSSGVLRTKTRQYLIMPVHYATTMKRDGRYYEG